MKSKFSALVITLALWCNALPALAQTPATQSQSVATITAIVGARVFDGTGRAPFPATVVINGARIVDVLAPNAAPPANAKIIRAEGQTLLPGLFDLHTHLPYTAVAEGTSDWPRNLQAYLYCGVTSVVDFGTYGETFEPMRRLVRNGTVLAPRISLAARFSTPGGHGAEGGRAALFTTEVSTPREARAAVKRLAETYQPDVLKVFTDGWRYGYAPDMTSMNEATLKALVDEAHQHGLKVLTHTVTLERAKIAARAGVDVLVHGIGDAEGDAELIQLMKQRGTFYVSTLTVYEPRGRNILSPLLDAVLDTDAKQVMKPPLVTPDQPAPAMPTTPEMSIRAQRWRNLTRNIKLLHENGVLLGNGTDAGVTDTYHGWATLREMALAAQAGVPNLAVLANATSRSAQALGVSRERGTIEAGKLADLLLVDGAPERNINDLENISRVWLNGQELDRAQLARNLANSAPTILPAVAGRELVDDFSRPDNRSQLDTLWVEATDGGHDHSKVLFGRTLHSKNDYALSILAQMSDKERPFVRVTVPLARGAIEPVDLRKFRGVRFDVRGAGRSRLIVPTVATREDVPFQTVFEATGEWRTIKIDFARLRAETANSNPINGDGAGDGDEHAHDLPPREVPHTPLALETRAWTGNDVLQLTFELARPAGTFAWLELDNVRFYK